MIFKSQQVTFDLEPWQCYNIVTRNGGKTFERAEFLRHAEEHEGDVHYEPRPEFEPTRDPEPWVTPGTFDAPGDTRHADRRTGNTRWAPRREQFDTPVNRVLVYFREKRRDVYDFLFDLDSRWADGYTFDEIEHARKVLTRLAVW